MTALLTTSWDDGHPLDLRLADLLGEFAIPATFYVPRVAPLGTMDLSQLRQLAGRFEIGGHTLDHCLLTQTPDAHADRQIADCKAWIEDAVGRPCTMFCPPAGKFAARHLEMVRRAGFIGLRSVELLSTDPPRRDDGLMLMGTTLQAFPHPRRSYVKNAIKRGGWRNLVRYVRLGGTADWERLADSLARQVASRGGVFHLWGHSWEIDRAAQWPHLRRVLQRLSELFAPAHRLTNGQACRPSAPPATPPASGRNTPAPQHPDADALQRGTVLQTVLGDASCKAPGPHLEKTNARCGCIFL